MSEGRRDFDREAARWDDNPGRVKVTSSVAEAILRNVTLTPEMDVLDYGCGTGLVTLRLRPFVRSVTCADSSAGMLEVLKQKAEAAHLDNVRTLHVDAARGDSLSGHYQAVVSSMTLHHIPDVPALLCALYGVLEPGGTLAIADLDPDGGAFHGDSTGVFHNGFDRSALRAAFVEAGFEQIRDTTAAEIEKPVAGGGTRRFTVFLMTGKKGR